MLDRIRKKLGFTMAELLIVVAIIAVLVAIAIPVFNIQLEKAREAYDVYTMRQAASLVVKYYYEGVKDKDSAAAAGLEWNASTDDRTNAFGVYNPQTGQFEKSSSDKWTGTPYGKGTKKDAGRTYTYNGNREIYAPKEDYTNAFVMVALYPKGNNKHIDVYWKNKSKQYIGGQSGPDDPKYSIRINID